MTATSKATAAGDVEHDVARAAALTDAQRIIGHLDRWWFELLVNRSKHRRRPAPHSEPDADELDARAERERKLAAIDAGYRLDIAKRLNQVAVTSIGESPAPGQVHVLDEIVLLEAAVLDLEEELRDHLGEPLVAGYDGPEYLPASRGPKGRPRWRAVNEQRRAPGDATRVLRKRRGATMLPADRPGATKIVTRDPETRAIVDVRQVDVFAQPALVTVDTDAGERDRVRAALAYIADAMTRIADDDVLEHAHLELRRARRGVRTAIGDVERFVAIPDVECPLCENLSLVEDQHSETITCTANKPGRKTVCSCGSPTCGCLTGERHSWHRADGGFVLLGRMVGPRVRAVKSGARIIWTRRAEGRRVSSIVAVADHRCSSDGLPAYCVEHRETFRTKRTLDAHLAAVGVHTVALICTDHGPELRPLALPPMLRRP